MNTSKNNFEYQIKKQIEEREVTPSRDLWSEIKTQSPRNLPKSNVNWYLAAACLILAFSLGTILFFYNESNSKQKLEIVKKINDPADREKDIDEPITVSPQFREKREEKSIAIKDISSDEKSETPGLQTGIEKKEQPLIREKTLEVVSDSKQILPEKIIAQSDSSKTPVKRKKYVDPSTLLFSVEHKDVIEKTKESNVATIDLNGK